MTFAASNVRAVLDTLSGEMGVLQLVGTDEDAKAGNYDRIVWVPRRRRQDRPREQPIDGKAIAEKRLSFDVHVYGHDFEAADARADALLVGLYRAFSENAADPFGAEGAIAGGGADTAGYVVVVPVSLLVPVYEQQWIQAQVQDGTSNGRVINTQDSIGEAIP